MPRARRKVLHLLSVLHRTFAKKSIKPSYEISVSLIWIQTPNYCNNLQWSLKFSRKCFIELILRGGSRLGASCRRIFLKARAAFSSRLPVTTFTPRLSDASNFWAFAHCVLTFSPSRNSLSLSINFHVDFPWGTQRDGYSSRGAFPRSLRDFFLISERERALFLWDVKP